MKEILKEMLKFEKEDVKEDVFVHAWGWLTMSALLLLLLGVINILDKFYAGGLVLLLVSVVQLKFAKKYRREVSKVKHIEFQNKEVER